MTKIKSFSVGNGDMFFIEHTSDNFSIIDCHLPSDDLVKKEKILDDITHHHSYKGIARFISTHPDQDHLQGLIELDANIDIVNFYCTKNSATKEDPTIDFIHYCKLRDDPKKAFYLHKGCNRKWMNQTCDERGSAGIQILWPDLNNKPYNDQLIACAQGGSPNNISSIIQYSLEGGAKFLWMGDLETSFMEDIIDEVNLSKVNVLFAPHHGRNSGRVPKAWLDKINPDIIVIGEAPSEHLNYYQNYNTIKQNSAKDITFLCETGLINIYTENEFYYESYLTNYNLENLNDGYYIGTLQIS
jgi:beta-lactamase superfamily II metal-dependent hydrolase